MCTDNQPALSEMRASNPDTYVGVKEYTEMDLVRAIT